ncbi:hypothetical protein GYH30_030312 [Glycine max]|nr:hypothetical protein GYH30_030312 [Glycine max]
MPLDPNVHDPQESFFNPLQFFPNASISVGELAARAELKAREVRESLETDSIPRSEKAYDDSALLS